MFVGQKKPIFLIFYWLTHKNTQIISDNVYILWNVMPWLLFVRNVCQEGFCVVCYCWPEPEPEPEAGSWRQDPELAKLALLLWKAVDATEGRCILRQTVQDCALETLRRNQSPPRHLCCRWSSCFVWACGREPSARSSCSAAGGTWRSPAPSCWTHTDHIETCNYN